MSKIEKRSLVTIHTYSRQSMEEIFSKKAEGIVTEKKLRIQSENSLKPTEDDPNNQSGKASSHQTTNRISAVSDSADR